MKFVVYLIMTILTALFATAESPPAEEALVLWLDASDEDSLIRNESGSLKSVRDLAGGRTGEVRGAVQIVPKALNARNLLRFGQDGDASGIDFPPWHDAASPISLFIVWQRTPEQASAREWQRLVACETPDRKNGFCITGAMRGSGAAMAPVLYTVSHVTASPLPFTVGLGNPPGTGNPLRGDIAEILVYNKRFDDADTFHAIEDYLITKWGCRPDPNSQGWLRPSNELPQMEPVREELPLHDQANTGKWSVYAPWTDRFDGKLLDDTRWYDYNPNWHGRAPARYLPRNVSLKDGKLGITMSMDAPKEPKFLYGDEKPGYHTYAAASVVSKAARTYGSFEIRCKAMPSYATSAWWFIADATNAQGEVYSNEIDVFEIGGAVPGEEARCGGNLHVVKAPGFTGKRANPAGWIAPFRFANDFHTFGLDWGPTYIRWYLDGSLYRSVRNTDWHSPLRMLFDTEIWSWWPDPIPEHFPSTFEVDYVRAWTRSDWLEPEGISVRPVSRAITKILVNEE